MCYWKCSLLLFLFTSLTFLRTLWSGSDRQVVHILQAGNVKYKKNESGAIQINQRAIDGSLLALVLAKMIESFSVSLCMLLMRDHLFIWTVFAPRYLLDILNSLVFYFVHVVGYQTLLGGDQFKSADFKLL